MNNIEYADKLIKLGNLLKNPQSKLEDIVETALDCGLIYTFGLIPDPGRSVDMVCSAEKKVTP